MFLFKKKIYSYLYILFLILVFNFSEYSTNKALSKTSNHRGAMMCKALVFISEKKYIKADKVLSNLIIFLEKNLEEDARTGIGTLAATFANRGIIKY